MHAECCLCAASCFGSRHTATAMTMVKLETQAFEAGEWMLHNSAFARAATWLLDGRQDGAVHPCSCRCSTIIRLSCSSQFQWKLECEQPRSFRFHTKSLLLQCVQQYRSRCLPMQCHEAQQTLFCDACHAGTGHVKCHAIQAWQFCDAA